MTSFMDKISNIPRGNVFKTSHAIICVVISLMVATTPLAYTDSVIEVEQKSAKEKPIVISTLITGKSWKAITNHSRLSLDKPHRLVAARKSETEDMHASQEAQEYWMYQMLDWRESPVDFSFLNADDRPAGRKGFLRASGDRLEFEDGSIAKFWGTNITAYAIFHTPREMVRAQAKRLAALGFNLVRLHHHDSIWVNPNIFGDEDLNHSHPIDPGAIDKIDWWIKCLKDEGIYTWLDLHAGRHVKPGDNIVAFDEISTDGKSASIQGYNYVNGSIQAAMKAFNSAYLTHLNKYTQTRYADEPAIAAVLITNENDITHHFGNALLPDKGVEYHSKRYMEQADRFAEQHKLPKSRVFRAWEHGSSKLFLNDLEYRFNLDMIQHLRSLGVKVPIVTTSTWGYNPLSSLPALTAGDMIDAHAYQPAGALKSNPLDSANFTHWLAAAQIPGKPTSITEWNGDSLSNSDRFTLPVYMLAQASLQGWDALMQYAYSQEPLQDTGSPSDWHAYNDPALLATMPAAALAYRRGDIRESSTTYILDLKNDSLFSQMVSPDNAAFIRTATERGKLLIAMPQTTALPWLKKSIIPAKAIISSDPNRSLIQVYKTEVMSDTGEIRRNWADGIMTIDTPKTQAAVGWVSGKKLKLSDTTFDIGTSAASIVVQSLDNAPISRSTNIIISMAARSHPDIKAGNQFISELVQGEIRVKAAAGLQLHRHAGKKRIKIPVAYENGYYVIRLEPSLKTYWLSLSTG